MTPRRAVAYALAVLALVAIVLAAGTFAALARICRRGSAWR